MKKTGTRKLISVLLAMILALFAVSGCSPAVKQPDNSGTAQTGGTDTVLILHTRLSAEMTQSWYSSDPNSAKTSWIKWVCL